MTKELDAVESVDEIRDAAKLLAAGKPNAFPVMQNQKLEGIGSSAAVINFLLEQY